MSPRVLLAFEPPDGGVAENVLQLATGLAAHGWEVELAGPEESIVYERLSGDVPVHRFPFVRGYGTPRADAAALRRLVRLLRTGRYDLVHCHSAKAGVLGRIAARLAGVPLVYSPHCFPFIGDFGLPRRVFATTVEVLLAPLGARTICVCEEEREQAKAKHLPRQSRLRVVHNGCAPCADDVVPDPATAQLRGDGPLAAVVSVLREQKRVDVFVDAAPTVLEAVPDARLAVVGTGPLEDELHARAATLGLDTHPRFAFLPFGAPAARHLKAADVYVLPSSWEAFPIGVLEALACGVPQVATDVGGTREAVVPETGRLVPRDDPGALAAALIELLRDPAALEPMAQASRARHADRFTVDQAVAKTAAVYGEVVPAARSASAAVGSSAG